MPVFPFVSILLIPQYGPPAVEDGTLRSQKTIGQIQMGFEFLVRAAFHVKELLPVDLQVDAQAAVGYVPKLYPWIQSAAVGLVKCCQIPLILQFPGGGAAQRKSGQGEDEGRSCGGPCTEWKWAMHGSCNLFKNVPCSPSEECCFGHQRKCPNRAWPDSLVQRHC